MTNICYSTQNHYEKIFKNDKGESESDKPIQLNEIQQLNFKLFLFKNSYILGVFFIL